MSRSIYSEPGWDSLLIVSDYKIRNEKIRGDRATATVRYKILAAVEGAETIRKKSFTENVTVSLVRENGSWKMEQYISYPRISVTSAITHLNRLLVQISESRDNNDREKKIREVIRQLRELEVGSKSCKNRKK